MKNEKQNPILEEQNAPLSITGRRGTRPPSYIPCIDWLQLNFMGTLKETPFYECICQKKGTRHFERIYFIKKNKSDFGVIAALPSSPIIPQMINVFKMENRFLYYEKPATKLIDCAEKHSLHYNNPTRIDLCIDFQRFRTGTKPQDFINDYFKNKYCKIGVTKGNPNGSKKKTLNTIIFGSGHHNQTSRYICTISLKRCGTKNLSHGYKRIGQNVALIWKLTLGALNSV